MEKLRKNHGGKFINLMFLSILSIVVPLIKLIFIHIAD